MKFYDYVKAVLFPESVLIPRDVVASMQGSVDSLKRSNAWLSDEAHGFEAKWRATQEELSRTTAALEAATAELKRRHELDMQRVERLTAVVGQIDDMQSSSPGCVVCGKAMSRSGYEIGDEPEINLWRGAVNRAIGGKRGQQFLREMATAMDAMPEKRLIADALVDEAGEVCAIGSVCLARGIDMSLIDADCPWSVARAVGIANALAVEIAYINDEANDRPETPEQRWQRVRAWIAEQIK